MNADGLRSGAGNPGCEICILAGGLSSRMGREKAALRLGRRTLLGHVRAIAQSTGMPVRVIRRDLIDRCGPLGGIYTALKTTRMEAVLFAACDMPFVSEELFQWVASKLRGRTQAVFTMREAMPGFPFILKASLLPVVEEQIAGGKFSLRALCECVSARRFTPATGLRDQLFNINTPEEWEEARRRVAGIRTKKGSFPIA